MTQRILIAVAAFALVGFTLDVSASCLERVCNRTYFEEDQLLSGSAECREFDGFLAREIYSTTSHQGAISVQSNTITMWVQSAHCTGCECNPATAVGNVKCGGGPRGSEGWIRWAICQSGVS